MSRPRFYPQWDFQVTTPKFQVATSLTATHVATSKMMSRHQAAPESFQLCCNLKISGCNTLKTNPGRDLKSMSRPHKLSTLGRNVDFHVTTKDFLLAISARSRHQKGCRDTNSSNLGRDAKTMSQPHPVWLRSRARCLGRGCELALSWVLLRAQPPLPCAPGVFLSRPQN